MQQKQEAAGRVSRIYLTGFMGAGKSTVGALLAAQLRWRFFDLDSVIEAKLGRSVSSIFAEQGEAHFRHHELNTLRMVQIEEEAIVSLGGGAVETEQIRALLAEDSSGVLVFLEAPLDRLVERCTAQDGGETRPLLRDRPLLASRYEKRVGYYQTAHLTVATQDLTPEEVAAIIMRYAATLNR